MTKADGEPPRTHCKAIPAELSSSAPLEPQFMFTSYRVIELVRRKISTEHVTASDTQVARAIGISRAAVSAYKTGRDVMTHETLSRANNVLHLSDRELGELGWNLLLESAKTDNEKTVLTAMRTLGRLMLVSGVGSATKAEASEASPAGAGSPVIYIKSNRRRWRKRGISLFRAPWLRAALQVAAAAYHLPA